MEEQTSCRRYPLSLVWGDIPETEFRELRDPVVAAGFVAPAITIFHGQFLEGWHHYRTAELIFHVLDGDPVAHVIGLNGHRLHMTPGTGGLRGRLPGVRGAGQPQKGCNRFILSGLRWRSETGSPPGDRVTNGGRIWSEPTHDPACQSLGTSGLGRRSAWRAPVSSGRSGSGPRQVRQDFAQS